MKSVLGTRKKLHYFINIFIINQVTIKLSTYSTIAGSDRSANNQCEGLFSGLRDLDTSFSRLLLNIQCLHGAGVPGRIDTRRVDVSAKQKWGSREK